MSQFLGEIMVTIISIIGPKGVNFTRYSIDYELVRNYLHILDVWGKDDTQNKLPDYAHSIVNHYLERDDTLKQLL